MRYLVGRYHEIALKGHNRWRFVEQLKRNVRETFADYRLGTMRGEGPRLIVELPDELNDRVANERAALIFGLQNFSISRPVALSLDAIQREAIAQARSAVNEATRTFRVRTRRSDKRFPKTSPEIDREIGAAIKAELGLAVDLEDPDLIVEIEVLAERALLSAGRIPGAGGLPVGISGRALSLISGGIDSPVAAYRMMKRGLRLDFVHFHSIPLLSTASRDKVIELVGYLTRYQARSILNLVPFAEVQREIVAGTLRPLRVVLYRRFMMRIASALAQRSGDTALVTGESLGQVASQTLDNLRVIENACPLAILRPLVGMDKNEIIEQARRLGTFETSILPDQDSCTLFVPAHPETHARLDEVLEAEARFDVEAMVEAAVDRSEVLRNTFPAPRK